MVNVAINGFGRIGRNTLRAAIKEGIFDKINYVAINDPGLKPEDAARIFKYDYLTSIYLVAVCKDCRNGFRILHFSSIYHLTYFIQRINLNIN